jgi:P27 family predicted phage terminase small subunit
VGLLTKIDRAALVIYCIAWSDLKDARKFISENGKTYTTVVLDKWGKEIATKIQEYPQVRQAREAEKMIHKIIAEFGMTPSSRSRMTLPTEKDVDDGMERLLSGG